MRIGPLELERRIVAAYDLYRLDGAPHEDAVRRTAKRYQDQEATSAYVETILETRVLEDAYQKRTK